MCCTPGLAQVGDDRGAGDTALARVMRITGDVLAARGCVWTSTSPSRHVCTCKQRLDPSSSTELNVCIVDASTVISCCRELQSS